MIGPFTGEYRWLSNFWPVLLEYEGLEYPTVEHAYQAAKTMDWEERIWISLLKQPGEAKREGGLLHLRPDWERVRLDVMKDLLRKKFEAEYLRAWLLKTGDEELVEVNTWNDTYWGKCRTVGGELAGANHLGRLLMEVRAELMKTKTCVVNIASLTMAKREQLMLNQLDGYRYIGRPSKWGNKYSHRPSVLPGTISVKTRAEAIRRYEQDLRADPQMLKNVKRELKGMVLVCWCWPEPCHGDILAVVAEEEV